MRPGNLMIGIGKTARVLLVAATQMLAGCTSFTTVRSARVVAGPEVNIHASYTPSPGDEAGWFWSLDCAQQCDHPIPGGDAGFAYGVSDGGGIPFALGAGLNGTSPYLEGYGQLYGSTSTAFGLGVRLGIPVISWAQHQLYARVDMPLAGSRLLWNPGLLYQTGNSPNGENPGSVVGLTNGFGVQFGDDRMSITPSLGVVWSRAQHSSYGEPHGPENKLFATFGLGIGFRWPR
jgi:hypothetical protein